MKHLFRIYYDFVTLGDLARDYGWDKNTIMKRDLIDIAKGTPWRINLNDFDIEPGHRIKVQDIEGKEYIVQDGDVIHFRFNV